MQNSVDVSRNTPAGGLASCRGCGAELLSRRRKELLKLHDVTVRVASVGRSAPRPEILRLAVKDDACFGKPAVFRVHVSDVKAEVGDTAVNHGAIFVHGRRRGPVELEQFNHGVSRPQHGLACRGTLYPQGMAVVRHPGRTDLRIAWHLRVSHPVGAVAVCSNDILCLLHDVLV